MNNVKSFFIVEFKSIPTGYFFVNSLVQKLLPEASKVIEIFVQAPAKLVLIFETTRPIDAIGLL